MSRALRRIELGRIDRSGRETASDVAAVEEPLQIRLNGAPFVVIMRTPGADRELTAGFLLSERVIAGMDDLALVRHCVDDEGGVAANGIEVTLAEDASARFDAAGDSRRAVMAASACGVCGRRTIDDLMTAVDPVRAAWRVPREVIEALPPALGRAQDAFAASGGLHAAGLFDREGRLLAAAEDVGRHNAVDKVIGAQLLLDRLPLDDCLLCVSGRAGFEILQKALVARIPIVAAVSAPSSLAIDLARDGGITLLGFVRGASFNIYTGAERIDVP